MKREISGKDALKILLIFAICICSRTICMAGPYTETGVNGYIGDDRRHADPCDADAILNPLFSGWATAVAAYVPAPDVDPVWRNASKALGPATGDNIDIVSLGDLEQEQIDANEPPGYIVLSFNEPIQDVNGYDFAVFENGFISGYNTGDGSVKGEMFAELAYIEVSTDGNNFVRFPSVSLTTEAVGAYGTLEISDVFYLAGKHPNAGGVCTGTAFDLNVLADDPCVIGGVVELNNINYVRIVDIPGSGDFNDWAVKHIDPNTGTNYDSNHPIYDAWVTWGSGGFDLNAVGVLKGQDYSADINLDGQVDMFDFALLRSAWRSHFGQTNWIGRCDLAEPADLVVDEFDLGEFSEQWLGKESWRD